MLIDISRLGKISVSLLLLSFMFINSSSLTAQNTQFWFAAPDISEQEGCGPFDSPIVIAISNATATAGRVEITFYNGGSPIVVNGDIPANGLYKYDITKATRGQVENPRGKAGEVTKYGIYIETTVPVTVYYQILAPCNQDIFSLKGDNALGTEFYVPMVHDSYYHTGSGYTNPVPYDQIDIVATEDNTDVFVTPKKVIRIGASGSAAANVEKKWTLQKGETLKIMEHVTGTTIGSASLGGTKIVATKPIAVTTSEDLIGRTNGGTGWDVIGDQIVPVSALGNSYVVIKGFLAGSDRAYLIATQDGTTINVNNGSTITPISLNAGGCAVADLGSGGNTNSAPQAVAIISNKPIYCYHVSGVQTNNDELGSGLLPSIYSIGQQQLSFYQYYQAGESSYGFVVFRTGSYNKFFIKYGSGAYQALTATEIDIPGMPEWKAAKIPIAVTTQSRIITLRNSASPFSFGFFSANNINGGSSYGYLSAFGQLDFPEYTYKCSNQSAVLDAGYAREYRWWKGKEEDFKEDQSNVIHRGNTYTVPATEEGYYSVWVDQDPFKVITTTYVKNDVLNLTTSVPALVKKNSTVAITATVNNANGKTFGWNFGAGASPATGTEQNPTGVQWSSTGSKTVSLTVEYAVLSCEGETKNHTVLVYDMQDDYTQTMEGVPVVVDVLANDDFTACASPTINISTQGSKGFATVAGGKVMYTPSFGQLGNDSFTYTVSCGSNTSAEATVSVYIAEKPDNISTSSCFVDPTSSVWKIKEHPMNATEVHNYGPILVGDIDGDGVVEIVCYKESNVNTYNYESAGIKIFYYHSGDGELKLKKEFLFSTTGGATSGTFGAIAIARYSNTGYIVVPGTDKYLYAYTPTGERLWKSDKQYTTGHYTTIVGIADFNNDGIPEVYTGNQIFSLSNGKLLCDGGTTGSSGGLLSGVGCSSAVADMDGDGTLELVAGVNIYKVLITNNNGTAGNSISLLPGMQLTATLPTYATKDGATQVVDIDNDGKLEVVVVSISNGRVVVYVWKPMPDNQSYIMGSYLVPVTVVSYYSIPMLGNIDDTVYPEIVFITNGSSYYMYALQFNPSSARGSQISQKWTLAHTDGSGCTGATLFDFDQDKRNEIVYRDETTLRIINGRNNPSTDPDGIKAVFSKVYSGTLREYPVIADIDGDGQSEILVAGSTSTRGSVGNLRLFRTDGSAWAPARKVWNQYAYSAVNVNEDLTIPRYQLSQAASFPGENGILGDSDDICPYNGFLQQQTTLSANGTPLWQAPEATFDGTPAYTWNYAEDKLEISVKVKNIGESDLIAPVYATAYKNSILPANKLATGSSSVNIAPGVTGQIVVTVPNISTYDDIGNIHIRINDNGTEYPVQKQCRYPNDNAAHRPLAGIPIAVNDTIQVRSNVQYNDLDILSNDTYSCSLAELELTIIPPLTSNGTAFINTNSKLDYKSNDGFKAIDKIYYKIKCNDSEDASIAIAHMVIFKPVRVVIVDGKDTAGETGSPKAKLRFEFLDNVTHGKVVEVTYTLTPDGEEELEVPAPPHKVEIPIGNRGVEVELTAKQNFIVQGNRNVTVTIVDVVEKP